MHYIFPSYLLKGFRMKESFLKAFALLESAGTTPTLGESTVRARLSTFENPAAKL